MYKLKKQFEGSYITLPSVMRPQFGNYMTLTEKTRQAVLKALFEIGHPGVEKHDKPK
jgi:hypothetical protein